MIGTNLWIVILTVIIAGCSNAPANYSKSDIVKIVDFELSPDEERIAFSGITPVGNLDIWVVDIDGKNLKKLTFQNHSPTNQVARFFKKHNWRNYFKIDMHYPEWTNEGRIAFCQGLTKYDAWGPNTISLRFWTINPDGTDKKAKTDKDKIIQRKSFDPINRAEISDLSDKYKKKILLKNGTLWFLDYGADSPQRLIQ